MTKPVENRQIVLASHPKGWVQEENMKMEKKEIELKVEKGSKDVLVRNIYLSLDPYMRGRMNPGPSYVPPFELGKPLVNFGVSQVVASDNEKFSENEYVTGMVWFEDYSLVKGGEGLRKVPTDAAPLSYFVGVLGMPGITAYFGLNEIGQPKEGETVLVSAASGAVGQLVGQLAKLKGCHVVGSAGSEEKIKILKEKFKYDTAFNYKEEKDLNEALKKQCPKGIDVYWENVGGPMLEAVLNNINSHGRIVACGMISDYNAKEGHPVRNLNMVVAKQVKMQGFLVFSFMNRQEEFFKNMTSYLKEGKVKYVEHITEGLQNAPAAFIGMLKGENIGKAVVKVA